MYRVVLVIIVQMTKLRFSTAISVQLVYDFVHAGVHAGVRTGSLPVARVCTSVCARQ